MHETLRPDVKGYIDFSENNHPYYKVHGWCFYDKEEGYVLPLRLSNGTIFVDIIAKERLDVSSHYNKNSIRLCGWEGMIETTDDFRLEMLKDGIWTAIFPFKAIDTTFSISQSIPSYLVVDNFYERPDKVREFALQCPFFYHPNNHKGCRTDDCYRFPGLKERFEQIVGRGITNWTTYGTNGCFQYCTKDDETVYHSDGQQYAGVLYLTPDAPPNAGTSLYRSRHTKKMKYSDDEYHTVFRNGHLDGTDFEVVDTIGNVYNRLILFDAKCLHAGINYFGTCKEDGRLFQLFFFDLA